MGPRVHISTKVILLISIPFGVFIVAAIFAGVYYLWFTDEFCYHGKALCKPNKSIEPDSTSQSNNNDPEIFSPTYTDFLYFSVQTIATCGYGDITPNTKRVRGLVTFEIIIGLFVLIITVAIIATLR